MVNHPNRRVVQRGELDGYRFPVRRKFKKNSLLSDDHYPVEVYVDFRDQTVYLHNKYGNGLSMPEVSGDAAAARLSWFDPASHLDFYEAPDEEVCLNIARLIQSYLDQVEVVTDEVKDVVKDVLYPKVSCDRENTPQHVVTKEEHDVFWAAVARMEKIVQSPSIPN